MSGSCQFFGSSLISWFSKKQSSVALSTAKAEYISARSCSTQILWLKAQLRDYGISLPNHSRTKHISIKHHFIRELVANKEIELLFIETE
ncbi:Retrovirus-related Pol polyprotein from transposon TNT 1-94 [Linum grandiflorum]